MMLMFCVRKMRVIGLNIWMVHIFTRVIEFLRNFEFRKWHTMRGGLMLPDSIYEEKLEIH